jgi:hypothetical protein
LGGSSGRIDNRSGLPVSWQELPLGSPSDKKAARPLTHRGTGGRETWPQRTRVGVHGISRASRAFGSTAKKGRRALNADAEPNGPVQASASLHAPHPSTRPQSPIPCRFACCIFAHSLHAPPQNPRSTGWSLNWVIQCEIGDGAAASSRRRCGGHGTGPNPQGKERVGAMPQGQASSLPVVWD